MPGSERTLPPVERLEVEWDPDKAEEVERRHGVRFEEAATVFLDPLAATEYDKEHSVGEERFVTIGRTRDGSLVVVAHTDRGGTIRLITARPATAAERRAYEQG